MTQAALKRLRGICLALPEAVEKETWENPTFRIRDKIFAMVHPADGRTSVWCKAPPGAQTILVTAAPERFFRPPYVGPKGWIGIWLDSAPSPRPLGVGAAGNKDGPIDDWAIDWDEVAGLIHRSYRMTAPKRLLKMLPE